MATKLPRASDSIVLDSDQQMTSGSDTSLLDTMSIPSALVPDGSVLHCYLMNVLSSGQPVSLVNIHTGGSDNQVAPTWTTTADAFDNPKQPRHF